LGIIFCLSIISKRLDSRSFSNNFDKTGSKLIGLNDSTSYACLRGFWIMMMCATFHSRWKTALSELQSWVINLIPFSGNFCRTLLVIRSYPGAFLEFNTLIAARTSLTVKGAAI